MRIGVAATLGEGGRLLKLCPIFRPMEEKTVVEECDVGGRCYRSWGKACLRHLVTSGKSASTRTGGSASPFASAAAAQNSGCGCRIAGRRFRRPGEGHRHGP